MTASDRLDRDLQSWLNAEAPKTAPVGLHEAVMERARGSRQRPRWLIALRGGPSRGPLVMRGPSSTRVAYLLVVVALLLVVVLVAIASGAFRSMPLKLGRNGPIVYTVQDYSQRNQPFHVHLLNADGTDDRAIGQATCATFSGDGQVLAFTSGSLSTTELNVAAADGSSPRVVPGIGESDYALSPDGKRVAWFKSLGPITTPDGLATVGLNDELWMTPTSGGPSQRIVAASSTPLEWYSSPVWSPDGRSLAFASNISVVTSESASSYRAAIRVVDQDGSHLRTLTTRRGTDHGGIAWSPDNRWVAYGGLPDGSPPPSLEPNADPSDALSPPLDIFVVDADGTDDRNLTHTEDDEWGPVWSPDGEHLAFQTSQSGGRLATVRMDGPDAVESPILGPLDDEFSWSPDGTTLLLLAKLFSDPSIDPQKVQSSILSVDADFRQVPKTLLVVDYDIPCPPSWQRLAP